MLRVQKAWVLTYDIAFMDVFWETGSTTEDPLDYDFYVERSEGYAGPWDPISPSLHNRYVFRDTIRNIGIPRGNIYYRIRTVHRVTEEEDISDPVTLMNDYTLDAIEIMRQHWITMREHNGRKCLLFPLRTFGQRCTSCYDPVSESRTRSNCRTCYGTGFVGGYLTPILTFIRIDAGQQQEVQQLGTKVQPQTLQAYTIGYPLIKPGDILVEQENVRWRVDSKAVTERRRAVVSQTLNIVKLLDDKALDLPADFTAAAQYLSRDYKNPHQTEGALYVHGI